MKLVLHVRGTQRVHTRQAPSNKSNQMLFHKSKQNQKQQNTTQHIIKISNEFHNL